MNLPYRFLYESREQFFPANPSLEKILDFLKLALDKTKYVCYYNQAVAE